ncbi:hypothetical protein OG232_03860 [Streptomyces sp. NBC_01411]|uniref:hypothetical protein n=1 Tax=Streptomyces sp. NBC_01411 TaxID=2903857 RepID=UPI003252C98E
MTGRTKVFTADIAERAVRVTWPDNDRGGATPPPDGWQDRAWAQEPTLHEIDEGSVSGCSILRWREDPRPDPELIGASLALVTGRPQAAPPAAVPPADRPLPPLLIGAQVEAYALVVRRQTCDDLAGELRNDGQVLAADLVNENRDFTEISRSLVAIPAAPKTEHGAYAAPSTAGAAATGPRTASTATAACAGACSTAPRSPPTTPAHGPARPPCGHSWMPWAR